jgi:putative chitinase
MFTIDRQRFFADWPARVRLPLTESRRKGVEFLLDAFERDQTLTMIRELAYVLATIRWESGHTFEPVRERRANAAKNPRLFALQERYWPTGFFGRGYVQMTWEKNYRLAGTRLAGETFTIGDAPVTFDASTLVQNPDYLLQRAVSYRIAVRGMREGWFTGKKLSQFITEATPPDYVNARRIINGTDRAAEIAAMANEFELLLRSATTVTPVTADVVAGATPAATDDAGASHALTRGLHRIGFMIGGGAARVENVTRRLAAKRRGTTVASPSSTKRARNASPSERAAKGTTGAGNRDDSKPANAKSAARKRRGTKASTPRRDGTRTSASKSVPTATAKAGAPKRLGRRSSTKTR